MGSTKIIVSLNGCDTSTEVELDVTEQELAFLARLADLINETAEYCMPTMSISATVTQENVERLNSNLTPAQYAEELLNVLFSNSKKKGC